jgi:hypothetical protein
MCQEGNTLPDITAYLNSAGFLTSFRRPWTYCAVYKVLTNENYIGNNVFNRTSFKLQQKRVSNPRSNWIRAQGAFEAIIPKEQFQEVAEMLSKRRRILTNNEILARLRDYVAAYGRVSVRDCCGNKKLPSVHVLWKRFGGIIAARRLIGYNSGFNYGLEMRRKLRKRHTDIVRWVVHRIEAVGAHVSCDEKTGLLTVNNEMTISIVVCRNRRPRDCRSSRWVIRPDGALKPDIIVAVRLDDANEGIRDYYLLPAIGMTWEKLELAEENAAYLDTYRHDTLDYFLSLTEHVNLRGPT